MFETFCLVDEPAYNVHCGTLHLHAVLEVLFPVASVKGEAIVTQLMILVQDIYTYFKMTHYSHYKKTQDGK